ncbi:MAG TPA: nucleotidyltransferase domain-containing protein [Saprospiraceae bacterium]|nr:nucleotidyltransferase domain-containing protein [Saprospiraceae bacterium]HPN69783.1 nucleotidyltransferase domain-containing protein [Saprospiraceae bacterium]
MNIPTIVKEEVNKILPMSEVILFGSRARNDFRSDSDWDFLILLAIPNLNKEIKNEILDRLYEVELKTDAVISSLIFSKTEWEKRSVMPIYKIIQEEGIAA